MGHDKTPVYIFSENAQRTRRAGHLDGPLETGGTLGFSVLGDLIAIEAAADTVRDLPRPAAEWLRSMSPETEV